MRQRGLVWTFSIGTVAASMTAATRGADAPQAATVSAADVEFFEKHVRPTFVAHCLECHGPKKQESGLRVDSRAALLRGGDTGPAIVPGRPAESLLLQAIRRDGDFEMPPAGKLPDPAIAAVGEWIRRGAPWPAVTASSAATDAGPLWSLQPVRRPEVPEIANDDWSRTPIDRFVLSRLHAAKLSPSGEASRETLIRRVAFDLLGLPPTPAEIAAFVADESPDAYERLVQRLLASPHYGERWGRHWLDVARYADNKGYVFFEEKAYPWAYTYRDYVVRAWNEDLPFDRFVVEQLAADRLAPAERSDDRAPAALGFLTVGGRFMNNVHDVADDQIDVVTRGLLGLTVTCARCHDHKFDPLTQADYYALYGVFRSAVEPTLPPLLVEPPETEEYRKFDAEMSSRLAKLDEFIAAKHSALVASAKTRAAEYLLAAQAQRDQPPTANFMLITDKGDLNPLMLVRWQSLLDATRRRHDPVWAAWHALGAIPPEEFSSRSAIALRELAASATPQRPVNALVLAALQERPLTKFADVAARYAALLNRVESEWLLANAADAQAAVDAAANPARDRDDERVLGGSIADASPEPLAAERDQLRLVFHGPDAPPDVPLASGWGFLSLLPDRASQEDFKKLLKQVETWSMTGPGAPARAMALIEEPVPYPPRIFLRGDPSRLGPNVPRRFLECLDVAKKPFAHGSGRLELARAIVDPANPLTARVIVNRLWTQHFDVGLVATPSDFGRRGDPPSHPELLDWLASELVAHGWSLKHVQRLIVTSSVYRQASDSVADGDGTATRVDPRTIDPENRLLWRMNRRRLDFESLRDALLAVSGGLDERIGGPAVEIHKGGFVPRRTLYGAIDRLDVPGLLTTFDFPNPAASSAQRTVTTVAPQALWLMNNDFVADAATRFAQRSEFAALTSPDERVAAMYRTALGRAPRDDERDATREYLGAQPDAERWRRFAHALLMTNEFLIVD